MALRQGGRALARSLMQAKSLPTRGGGGGPVKYAATPDKELPLWDELWWDDGLYHSQPVLDGTLEPQLQSPGETLTQLAVALGLVAGSIFLAGATYNDKNDLSVLEAFTSRGKVEWARAP